MTLEGAGEMTFSTSNAGSLTRIIHEKAPKNEAGTPKCLYSEGVQAKQRPRLEVPAIVTECNSQVDIFPLGRRTVGGIATPHVVFRACPVRLS